MDSASLAAQKRFEQGMTLVEVLIAAVIVAVGLLGIASLQINALQGSTNADYRTRAIDFATSLSDRMQANLIGVADNEYLIQPSCDMGSLSAVSACAMTPQMGDAASVANCSPRQMASYDLHQIGCGPGIQNSLPGGRLQIDCVDADTSDADPCSELSPMLITISWLQQGRVTDAVAEDVEAIKMTVIPGEP
ncbi:MAG: type IV pilus modification protein PilV [gamma proteobacterium symbiont of Ctena orbiculata]|nr:MAG: type IV pilus modification protein PilV [gamma proteobacterium symbiont of Ctena orbiculata]PUB76826.1 MAG: type IV pilus modification protein PilV [gamma proteobacterium symbiont of Ctena orbiculata]